MTLSLTGEGVDHHRFAISGCIGDGFKGRAHFDDVPLSIGLHGAKGPEHFIKCTYSSAACWHAWSCRNVRLLLRWQLATGNWHLAPGLPLGHANGCEWLRMAANGCEWLRMHLGVVRQ